MMHLPPDQLGGRVPIRARPSMRHHRLGAIVNSNRFAVTGVLSIGVFLPELAHPFFATHFAFAQIVNPSEPSMIATAIALLLAHVALRRTASQPFIDSKIMVLPAMVMAFGVTFAALTLWLHKFGLYHPTTGFGLGLAWYLFLAVIGARLRPHCIAVAGGARPDSDLIASRIQWKHLGTPRIPQGVIAIAFDSEQAQTPQWDRLYVRAVLRGLPVYDLAHLREMLTGRVRLQNRPELVFGQLQPNQPYLRIKRFLDTLLAIPALLLALPVLAITALLICLESPGSPIYRQSRVGYQGRIFTCYKLRSMRNDIQGPLYTDEADPRITRIGRIIRKWRIDELPQIVNVLKGDMSWIGPRPEALRLARAYGREIPYYGYRHMVRPGITGWAAVHQGNVALTEAATRKLEYDFYYLKYFSIWLDFVIVLLTIRTVVTGFGSR